MLPVNVAVVASSIEWTKTLLPVAHRLEADGHAVYWIAHRKSEAVWLAEQGVLPNRILDVPELGSNQLNFDEIRTQLAALDQTAGPRLHDIILMDRLVRRKPYELALRYIHSVYGAMKDFLETNRITIVLSGRDTALQLIAMKTCRQLGILWTAPTMVRLPRRHYGFSVSHAESGFLPVRSVSDEDRAAASAFLSEFRSSIVQPEFHLASGTWAQVFKKLPAHLRALIAELRLSRIDRGNDLTRYTIAALGRMYLTRRYHLLRLQLAPLFDAPGDRPYCLYALHMQPESSIDVIGSFFSNQLNLITILARSVPVTHDLYVRVHPSDLDGPSHSFYEAIKRLPGVRLIGPTVGIRDLMKNAAAIITVSGTIAYEAGLLDIPAITFSDCYFNRLPSVHCCTNPTEIPALLAILLRQPRVDHTQEIAEFVAELLASSYPGQFDGYFEPLTDAEVGQFKVAIEEIAAKHAGPGAANGNSKSGEA